MAQRFGRVNRFGQRDDTYIDIVHPANFDDKDKLTPARRKTLELLLSLNERVRPPRSKLDSVARLNAFAPRPIAPPISDMPLRRVVDDLDTRVECPDVQRSNPIYMVFSIGSPRRRRSAGDPKSGKSGKNSSMNIQPARAVGTVSAQRTRTPNRSIGPHLQHAQEARARRRCATLDCR